MNVRYPGKEPVFWYLLPSLDVLIVFAALALFAIGRRRVPKGLRIALVASFVLVRFLRLGDGIQQHFFAAPFNLYTDLPLFPELVRFVHSSLGIVGVVLVLAGLLAFWVGLAWACYAALLHTERYFRRRRHLYVAAAFTAGLFLVGRGIGHKPQHAELFTAGGLAASSFPRLTHEWKLLVNMYSDRATHAQAIERVQAKYRQIPTDLAKLKGVNVHLIYVESYGRCVLEWPHHVRHIGPTFDAFESELGAKGFSIVTGVLDSTTYGGQSWLAHATIATGVRTTNHLEYELVLAKKPKAIATFFREAGYRTVLVSPGTTRPWPKGEFYNFEQKYFRYDIDYRGPAFAWASMPDQYVLDFVRRNELERQQSRPLFILYQLVSSHAPWSDLPPIVEDWSQLGDGSIFRRLERIRYPIKWPNFENAEGAYIDSIRYDFEVLRRFISRYIHDGSLVIIMGDHQPVWDVNGHSELMGVPVHVLSRDRELLEPFIKLGYTPGLRKTMRAHYPGLETFLPDLLAGFSTR